MKKPTPPAGSSFCTKDEFCSRPEKHSGRCNDRLTMPALTKEGKDFDKRVDKLHRGITALREFVLKHTKNSEQQAVFDDFEDAREALLFGCSRLPSDFLEKKRKRSP